MKHLTLAVVNRAVMAFFVGICGYFGFVVLTLVLAVNSDVVIQAFPVGYTITTEDVESLNDLQAIINQAVYYGILVGAFGSLVVVVNELRTKTRKLA